MNKKFDVEKEWDVLRHEINNKKPKITPYPKDTVKKRELLLAAQVILAKYQNQECKLMKDAYLKLMDQYFDWESTT